MKIVDLASIIWKDELSENSITTIPEIAFWIRNTGIGKLNDLIHTEFTVNDSTLEIEQASFGINEAVILIQLYLIKYFKLQADSMLGAAGIESTIEYSEGGMSVRKISKNELAKSWMSLMREAKDDLKTLITGYKIGKSTPKSIEGEELLLISSYLPRYNRVLNNGL